MAESTWYGASNRPLIGGYNTPSALPFDVGLPNHRWWDGNLNTDQTIVQTGDPIAEAFMTVMWDGGEPHTITEIEFWAYSEGRTDSGYWLESSDDHTTWTELMSGVPALGAFPASGMRREWTGNIQARYIRLVVWSYDVTAVGFPDSSARCGVHEFGMVRTPFGGGIPGGGSDGAETTVPPPGERPDTWGRDCGPTGNSWERDCGPSTPSGWTRSFP